MEPQNTQKPSWADPSPAGLTALAVACFCFFPLLTGLVKGSAAPLVGCWLLGGFVIQIIVALIDLKKGNQAGGNTFMYFSAFFMLASGLAMFIKGGVFGQVAVDSRIDGWAWIALSFTVILWTPAFLKSAGQLFLIVCFLDIAAPVIAIKDIGAFTGTAGTVLGWISGTCLLICGLLGIWLAAAIIVNNALGKTVIPVLKPFYRPKKTDTVSPQE